MKLVYENGWSIVPLKESFLFYVSAKGEKPEGYFRYTFDSIQEISVQDYCKGKFGSAYNNILNYFENDCVVTECVVLDDESRIVTEYRDSYVHKFDSKGNLIWRDETLGEFGNIYSFASENNHIWCAYPSMNTIKKFSLTNFNEEVAISNFNDMIFDSPEFINTYGDYLYVCDTFRKRICTINLNSYEIKEYMKFDKETWEYYQIAGREIVRLQSGIYLID